MIKKIFLLFLIVLVPQIIFSQVGINTDTPNSLTALDIDLVVDGTDVVPKGIMVPRMTEAQRDKIDVSDSDNANSLLVYNTTEDCFNYFSKTENEWVSLCGDSDLAVFTVDCTQSSVKGNYMVNSPLNSSNYIVLTVTVTTAGTYNISAVPATDNGYYFSAIGEFVRPGSYTLMLPGVGKPQTSNEYGDQLLVKNENELLCDNLIVKINAAQYTLDCSSVVVSGDYVATVPLTSDNTIQIKVTADASLAGYVYDTTTPIVNGYSFSTAGTLVEGEQTITLTASGTPIKNGTDTFVLENNSTIEGIPSCDVSITVASRPVRVLTVTSSSVAYNLGNSSNYANKALLNTDYFGLGSGATYSNSGFVFTSLTSNGYLESALASFNPDIVFTQYAFIPSKDEITAMNTFVNNGGVFIYCTDNTSTALSVVQTIFDDTSNTITLATADSDDVVTLENSGTTITKGPFMDLTGLGFARDQIGNFGFTASTLPTDKITVIAYTSSGTGARMFIHKTKGFVFVGDGGPFASSTTTSAYNAPAKFTLQDSKSIAIVNSYSSPVSYNSFLLMNTISWAIDYIKNSGIYP